MTRSFSYLVAVIAASLFACSNGDQVSDGPMTTREHSDRVSVEQGVLEAINEPNGGDYARAVAIIRASGRPDGVINFETGQLVVDSFDHPGSRRPTETLQKGLDLMEQAAVASSESRDVAQQRLRMIFERGIGPTRSAIPIDRVVADCWHKLENGRPGDPARCVALRRERLPRLSL